MVKFSQPEHSKQPLERSLKALALSDEDKEDSDLEILPNPPQSVYTIDLSHLPDESPSVATKQKFKKKPTSNTEPQRQKRRLNGSSTQQYVFKKATDFKKRKVKKTSTHLTILRKLRILFEC